MCYMKTNIYHLDIIPINSIIVHEKFDILRATPLIKKITADGALANPIIVASLDKGTYLQLDGMNRLSAFKKMGFKTILAQVVDYNDQESIELSSWVHISDRECEILNRWIETLGNLTMRQGKLENVGHRYIREDGFGRICTVIMKNKDVYLISSNGNLHEKVHNLDAFVSCYHDSIVRDVLPLNATLGSIDLLFLEHPGACIIIIFPTFTRHQIIDVAKKGGLFPAGITRHIFKRRCLSVDVPLSIFSGHNPIKKQRDLFDNFISKRCFRVYEEPTIYFE